eukprot:m.601 g.601  ORF g.601 m.601 type:complete len:78 (+) comp222_c1_seq1:258-491(+)
MFKLISFGCDSTKVPTPTLKPKLPLCLTQRLSEPEYLTIRLSDAMVVKACSLGPNALPLLFIFPCEYSLLHGHTADS